MAEEETEVTGTLSGEFISVMRIMNLLCVEGDYEWGEVLQAMNSLAFLKHIPSLPPPTVKEMLIAERDNNIQEIKDYIDGKKGV